MRWMRNLLRSDDGGALAELAILVPFLVVMLAAVSELGRYFQAYNTVAKATRTASRYLSNHQVNNQESTRAISLVVCGKLTCAVGDKPLAKNFTSGNVCLETIGSPKVTSVIVRVVRTAGDCGSVNPAIGGTSNAVPYVYQPTFNIGALLQVPSFTLALPIAPRTQMYYMLD
jgi:Flp pilus assembly protein TadG